MAGSTGTAAVVTGWGEPLELWELPVPTPEPGALVVRVDVATVCGSDVHIWEGALEGVIPIELPLILGHEIVGEVVAIGAGAEVDSAGDPLSMGDRVIWAHEACGRCFACSVQNEPTLCPNRRVGMNSNCNEFPRFTGGFGEYSYVWPRSGRLRVPDEIRSEWASAASCALRTVVNAVERAGRIDFLDDVVIQGAGPLGLFATALVATHSPRRLIVVGAPDERLEIARAWGASHVVSVDEHPDGEQRVAAVRELTGGRGGTVVLELAGARTSAGEALEMAAPAARCVFVGSLSGASQPFHPHLITTRQLQVMGTLGGEIDSYYKALQFLKAGRSRFDWDLLLGNRFGLDSVGLALQRMQSFAEIKPIIDPSMRGSTVG